PLSGTVVSALACGFRPHAASASKLIGRTEYRFNTASTRKGGAGRSSSTTTPRQHVCHEIAVIPAALAVAQVLAEFYLKALPWISANSCNRPSALRTSSSASSAGAG